MEGFVPKKITLSEEALKILEDFKREASFRSLSATIEEITRRIYYVKECPTLMAVNIQFERLGIVVKEP